MEIQHRGTSASFLATGQTGILIGRRGICIDAAVADFISGPVEALSPDYELNSWVIIEDQGQCR